MYTDYFLSQVARIFSVAAVAIIFSFTDFVITLLCSIPLL
jgi:hypothetical protein